MTTHDLEGPTKTSLLSTVVAIYDIGCFVGAISACYFGEKLGRKKTVLMGTSIMTLGAILQAASVNVPMMIVGRIIGGIGNGLNTGEEINVSFKNQANRDLATAPVWQTETSQMKWRGKLVVIELILNIGGFSLSNWMTFGFSYVGGPISWRFPVAFQLVFIMILFGTVPWLPESPRWLIAHEYEDEAFQILADLEGKDSNDPYILQQHKEIVYTVQYERQNGLKWMDLLKGKTAGGGGTCTLRRLFLGAGTQFMQQFSGISESSPLNTCSFTFANKVRCNKLLFAHFTHLFCRSQREDGTLTSSM